MDTTVLVISYADLVLYFSFGDYLCLIQITLL
jgi:hypothetical protein